MRKVYKWGIKEAVTGLKKSTADEKHLIAMSLGNRKKSSKELTQDLRDGSGLTAGPSTKSSLKPHWKWFQRKGGFKGRTWGEKPEVRQIENQGQLV